MEVGRRAPLSLVFRFPLRPTPEGAKLKGRRQEEQEPQGLEVERRQLWGQL